MLTEAQLEEAQQELKRREAERAKRYSDEYWARQHAAEKRFWERMLDKYPQLDQDTMYEIYSEIREFSK
jgi:hypothetical protein